MYYSQFYYSDDREKTFNLIMRNMCFPDGAKFICFHQQIEWKSFRVIIKHEYFRFKGKCPSSIIPPPGITIRAHGLQTKET